MSNELVRIEVTESELRTLISYHCDVLSDCVVDVSAKELIEIVVRLHMLIDHLRELTSQENVSPSGPRLVQ